MKYFNIATRSVLTKEEAIEVWRVKNNQQILLTSSIPDKYLETCRIYRIYPNYLPIPKDKQYLSSFYTYPSIDKDSLDINKIKYDDTTNKYTYDIEPVFSQELFDNAWADIRKQRNILLAEVDWVLTDENVTLESKNKVKAYKQLLRKLPELFQSPIDVCFPAKPKISFLSDSKRKTSRSYYKNEEEVEELLNKHNTEVIEYWHKLNKPLEKSVIKNIIDLYS